MNDSARPDSPRVRRAIISVSDKTGLAEFAGALVAHGVELYASGGTHKFLCERQLPVTDIAAYTGFPEMLDGRVKTLHPKIHGGILARHDHPDDLEKLQQHGIATFELVVVNLYPFGQTVARPNCSYAEAVENIDIGGPSLVRGAAKNHAFITVATSPGQYSAIIEQLHAQGKTSYEFRQRLAYEAYSHTAAYDQEISRYLAGQLGVELFPANLHLRLSHRQTLRYGENPHQQAALYAVGGEHGASLLDARWLGGKELSYNNLLDLDSALAMVKNLAQPAAVVVKHNNPCGAAAAETLVAATKAAFAGDPVSAFGSVLGFNRAVDAATAEVLSEPGLFVEAIAAPDFEPDALEILRTKPKWKANVRLLAVGPLDHPSARLQVRQIEGGLLVQEGDTHCDPPSEWRVVTKAQPTDAQLADLRFAWEIARHVKSNAIVIAENQTVWGVGAGQMSRVDSTEIALSKAQGRVQHPVLASDAFFPFADSIHHAAKSGVCAVIQPGGSKRDDEVIAACDEHSIPMIFTGRRHFKH
jgi:phosphoribosylaminoimidazolecarboxamide formyltransferase/IMP cyclohydrolase